MAFETAVRNPERYKGILSIIKPYISKILDEETLLEIVCSLYLNGIVSSDKIEINENSTLKNITNLVIKVNSTRRADGGFPKGYPSRFWTYVRSLSEMGFVFAKYKQHLRFSEIALKLINNEIDEQEAFSIQAIKYNRRSPYRNVSNDFNYFKFIIEVLKQCERISYEQFIISTFSYEGNTEVFLNIINNNVFNDLSDVELFIRYNYNTNLKTQTILRDYPDVILRLLVITGFVSIQYHGKTFICRNISNDDYIKDLLSINVNFSEKEKQDALLFFTKTETYNQELLKCVYKHRKTITRQDGFEYSKKLYKIIELYKLNEKIISENINYLGTSKNSIPIFKYIAEPLKLEFYVSLLLVLKYGKNFAIKPNYKSDYIGLPISHAPANIGDIEVYSDQLKLYWLIEVTLIRNKTQQLNNETTSVIRHFMENNTINHYISKYLSFIAPVVHQDTKEFYDYSIIRHKIKNKNFSLKPYSISEFVNVTLTSDNFKDMENYTKKIAENFRKNLK